MGNIEHNCLSRNQQMNNKNRPSQLKKQFASERLRNSFLFPIDREEIIQYAKAIGIQRYNPYSKLYTNNIIQLSKLNQGLDFGLCRYLLTYYDQNFEKINQILQQNKEFRQSVRPIDIDQLKQVVTVIGLDFKQGLVLRIKLEHQYAEHVQQYILFFLEYLFYEIARINKLSNHVLIVYDLQFEAVNPIFLNFMANLTFKHYFLNIRKLILVNINIEKISSEVIGMLSQPEFKYFVLPLSDTTYLCRYVRKSELSIDYGGMHQKSRMPIPLSLIEALNYQL